MKFRSLLLLFLPLLLCSLSFATADRVLAGPAGETVSIERGDLSLVASTAGTEELATAGEPVTVSWPSNGAVITVTVYPQPGENDDALTIRLARRVNALRKSFPLTNPPGG